MASDVHAPDDFIAYPTNRVVGTIADPASARAAIEALLKAGFTEQDIDVLHSGEDLHRSAPAGAEHRFLAQFQRTVFRKLVGEYRHLRLGEEYDHLRRYIDDARAGRSVILVLARKREKREAAADILGTYGAELIEFYGRWSWQALESHPAERTDGAIGTPAPGRTYEIDLGGTATHLRLESATTATILRKSAGAPDVCHLPVTELRPNLLMVAWQDADRTTTVHVYDFESGEAHGVVGYGDRRVRRARGTVRPAGVAAGNAPVAP
jgi:hypothetical protein